MVISNKGHRHEMELEYGKGELSTSPFPISNIQSPKVWNGATTPKLDLCGSLNNGNVTSNELSIWNLEYGRV